MIRRSNILVALLGTCLLSGALTGCRSSRKAVSPTEPERAPTVVIPSQSRDDASPTSRINALIDTYDSWTDVSMPVKCSLSSPKNISISGKAVMIRGKELRISFRMLGFEVGGLYVDTDSIFFYEKLNRTMVVEALDKITKVTGMELSDIQDLLLGQLACPGAPLKDFAKKFAISADGDNITAKAKTARFPWMYSLSATPDLQLHGIDINLGAQGDARCVYNPPFVTPAGPVSPVVQLNASVGKTNVAASMEWSLESADWNKGINPQRNLPKGYRRIPFLTLIRSLGSF